MSDTVKVPTQVVGNQHGRVFTNAPINLKNGTQEPGSKSGNVDSVPVRADAKDGAQGGGKASTSTGHMSSHK